MEEVKLTLGDLLEHRQVQLEKRVISWYTYKDGSWDGDGYIGQDVSGLKYLHLPESLTRVQFDLNRSHPDDDFKLAEYAKIENIGGLLSWIKEFGNQDNWFAKAEIICQSHHLIGMLKMLYEPNDLLLQMEVFDGKIYMRRLPDERVKGQVAQVVATPDAFRVMRVKQGLKCDSYLLSESPYQKPDPAKPLQRDGSGSRMVLHVTIGEHNLLYTSALKCLDNAGDLQNLDQATFTTSKTFKGNGCSSLYRNIWMDWWCLNTLGKVNRTVIAFLPSPANGKVSKLEIVDQSEMFRMIQSSKVGYKSYSQAKPQEKVCFSCLDEILTFIKSATSGASDGDIFELKHYEARPGVVKVNKVSDLPKPEVVPAWFKEWVASNKPAKAE